MRTLVSVLLGFALLLGPRSGWGCELPATGQTTCWDSNGNVIPCAGTGQDGELREGAPLAYVDHGDGTVTDVNTGLMWEKLSHDGTVHDDHNTYTWANAISGHVATLNSTNFAGHNDWRLPNVRELLSIVTYQNLLPTVAPAFDNHCSSGCDVTRCSCTFSGDTWTSTSEADSPSNQWFVDFQDGQVGAGLEHGSGPVRAVRDASTGCPLPATGQTTCWDSSRNVIPCAGTGQDGELRKGAPLAYVDNGNGTVTDLNTGLVWEKLSERGDAQRHELRGPQRLAAAERAGAAGHRGLPDHQSGGGLGLQQQLLAGLSGDDVQLHRLGRLLVVDVQRLRPVERVVRALLVRPRGCVRQDRRQEQRRLRAGRAGRLHFQHDD